MYQRKLKKVNPNKLAMIGESFFALTVTIMQLSHPRCSNPITRYEAQFRTMFKEDITCKQEKLLM